MNLSDIRAMFEQETPATDAEARQTAADMRSDPAMARMLLITLYSLAGDDRDYNELLRLILKVGTMQLLINEAQKDDTFALHMANMILDAIESMHAEKERPVRGRQGARKAKSA